MKNWQKQRNYKKHVNPDGSFTYIIIIDEQDVEVTESVYREYAKSARKMEYMESDLKRDRVKKDSKGKKILDENGNPIKLPEREVSLEKLINEKWDFPALTLSPEDALIQKTEYETLYSYLALLNKSEYALIHALYFKNMTEREYSEKSGIPQKTINDRKKRILRKLKNYFSDF